MIAGRRFMPHASLCRCTECGGRARAQVRDYMDPENKFQRTLCCLDKAHSFEGRDECMDPSHAHAEGLRCMHVLHTNPNCATPTLNEEHELPMYSYYDMSSDWEWIAEARPRPLQSVLTAEAHEQP